MPNSPNVNQQNEVVPDVESSDGDSKGSSSLELLALVTASFGPPEQHISAAVPALGSTGASTSQSFVQQQSSKFAGPDELLALVTASFPSDSW